MRRGCRLRRESKGGFGEGGAQVGVVARFDG